MAKKRRKTRVIPKPLEGTRTILAPAKAPVIKGQDGSGINVACGHCGKALVVDAADATFSNIVLRCPLCGAYGELA